MMTIIIIVYIGMREVPIIRPARLDCQIAPILSKSRQGWSMGFLP